MKRPLNWLEEVLLRRFYRHYGVHFGLPLMIRHKWGVKWTFVDRYGERYLLTETGNHEGTPLQITRASE